MYDDERYKYLVYELSKLDYKVYVLNAPVLKTYANIKLINNPEEMPANMQAIILPVRGLESDYSAISKWNKKACYFGKQFFTNLQKGSKIIGVVQKNKIEISDIILLNNDDNFALKNALLTAEGSLYALMQLSKKAVRDTNSYVLGYGKCGKALARLLKAVDINTTVVARREVSRSEAWRDGFRGIGYSQFVQEIKKADSIFNTVPAYILCECVLRKMSQNTVIIDIASSPGGTDFEVAEQLGIKAVLKPGIPGKYSPSSAGEIMANCINKKLIEGGV
nr:dipicolinate synthase subunit DpsA [Clostridium sp. 'deep sea']